jgi:hypothetical protein
MVHVDILELVVFEMYLLPGELGVLSMKIIDLGNPDKKSWESMKTCEPSAVFPSLTLPHLKNSIKKNAWW